MRYLWIVVLLSSAIVANHISRGEKVLNIFCQKEKLKSLDVKTLTANSILKYCHDIDLEDAKDVKSYLANKKEVAQNIPSVTPIPKDARCPVCGMVVAKYPKWATLMTTQDKKLYFDGIKDMMKYYLDSASFHYDRAKINNMVVLDFYHLKSIDAKRAWYVIGSDIGGAMGDELIPFSSLKDAKTFMQDHHGKKIIRFKDITLSLIKWLDRF